MSAQIITYIKSISISEVSEISEYYRVVKDVAYVKLKSKPSELNVAGLAKFVVSSAIENKSRVWTAKLNVRLSEVFNLENRSYILFLTATDGKKYVIGADTKPFPMINFSASMPDRSSEPVAYELSAEYIDTFGLTRLLLDC